MTIMNTPSPTIVQNTPRAVPFSTVSFEAFRVVDGRTYALGYSVAVSRDDAIFGALAAQAFAHKDQLLIRETTERKSWLHIYQIKRRSSPTYVYCDYQTHREQRLYAAHLCTIDESILKGGRVAEQAPGNNNGD